MITCLYVYSIMKCTEMLMSAPQFFQFIIFVMFTVLAIGSFEQSIQNMTPEFVSSIHNLVQELVAIFFLCLFATNLTFKSTKMAKSIYNIRWYALRLRQQIMIAIIVRQGQVPFQLHGYIFNSSLETFVKVSK